MLSFYRMKSEIPFFGFDTFQEIISIGYYGTFAALPVDRLSIV